ncbi:MAG: TonB family protein [Candidatus Melainabacteria bacterium]|nr:TonB family protein [Candidatus Melainabacteria bacterium]
MGKIGRFICPACHAINVQTGNCFKCGAQVDDPGDIQSSEHHAEHTGSGGEGADTHDSRSLRSMQGPGILTKQQIMFAVAGILLIAAFFMMMSGQKSPQPATQTQIPVPATPQGVLQPTAGSTERAIALAVRYAGFKDTPPPNWCFEDTSDETGEMPSFGMKSVRQNLRAIFVVWDNVAPVENLELVLHKVPFMDYGMENKLEDIKMDKGQALVGEGPFNWFVGRYHSAKDNHPVATFVGSYKSPVPGKAIVVIARSVEPATTEAPQPGGQTPVLPTFDYKVTLWLVDTMASGKTTTTQAIPQADTSEKPLATAEELGLYTKKVDSLIRSSFRPPKEAAGTKVAILIGITEDGQVNKLEITSPSGVDVVDQSVLKAITSGQPYPPAPHTKDNAILLHVTTDGTKLQVQTE